MKREFFLLYIIFILSTPVIIFSNNRLPLFIKSMDKVFIDFSDDISKKLPKGIDILCYEFMYLNCSEDQKNNIDKKFFKTLSGRQQVNNYSIKFIEDIVKEKPDFDYSFLKKQDEFEFIAYGKLLQKDVVLLANISVIENKNKWEFDFKSGKWQMEKVALFQGNFFSTDTNSSIFRFSYYFLID
jgi:hypothetical protein